MHILIVEDNVEVAQLLPELLRGVDRQQLPMRIESIDVAGDLETAIALLPAADAVLCDGSFPLNAATTRATENWAIVSLRAQALQIRVVVYSGDPGVVNLAAECGLVAVHKPAPAEVVYAAMVA